MSSPPLVLVTYMKSFYKDKVKGTRQSQVKLTKNPNAKFEKKNVLRGGRGGGGRGGLPEGGG